ncbi:MAG: T9SS C-terminal target domain-containing protein [Stygiobacter sp.]|nr:MAG: T9SS C-terminal target domain-containing protein [Stygiobacter sp.]
MKAALTFLMILLFVITANGQKLEKLIYYNKLNSPLPSYKILCIAIDSTNCIWIGTDTGLSKFDGKTWNIYNKANGLISNSITSISIDVNNNVWIIDSCISKYDGNRWHHYNDKIYGNIPAVSKHLVIDSNGNKWLINNFYSLVKFDGNGFTEKAKLNSEILSLYSVDNQIWFNTQSQVYSYENNILKNWGWDRDNNWGIDKLYIDKKNNKLIASSIYRVIGDSWNFYYNLHRLVDSSNYEIIGQRENYGLLTALAFEDTTNWYGIYYYGLVKAMAPSGSQVIGNFSFVNDILIDKYSNKWINYGGGIAVYNENGVILTDVKNSLSSFPNDFVLSQNFPNPFNPETTISYTIPVETRHASTLQHVILKVYDLLGREVATLVDEYKQAGAYKVTFNVKTPYMASLPSGVYFYQLRSGNFFETKKMLLLK